MRADRLLSLMMLLQTQRQMTAKELADELEVSKLRLSLLLLLFQALLVGK